MNQQYVTFDAWMTAVDNEIAKRACGVTSGDLPDCGYADWYEDGVSPKSAASKAIRSANGELV